MTFYRLPLLSDGQLELWLSCCAPMVDKAWAPSYQFFIFPAGTLRKDGSLPCADPESAGPLGHIHLRLGMEMGDAQKAPAHMKKLLEDAPQFDFIIGSVHLLSERFGSEDLYLYTPKDQAEAQTALGDYLEEVLALAKLGGFTVLGHLTLPLRYFNEMRGLHTSFDPYEAEIREILKTLIENGRGIELNVNRGNTPLPDAKWLRIYRELGGELITLGTDAHSPEHVGRFIRERQTLLKECGFTRFCTFEKQMPVWHAL